MANEQNIIGINEKRTPERRREIASNAGKASVEARRKRADLREALQTALTGEYTTAEGDTVTGAELLVMALIKIAGDPKNKGAAVQAFNTISKMLGQDMPERDGEDDDMVKQFLNAMRG